MDDWSFAISVKNLIEKSTLRFTDWVSMPLIVHIFWGTFFCKIFGFSFTVLRLSILFLGLIGIITTYYFFKALNINSSLSLAGSLIVATNPVYFELSCTYMTDVPFYTFSIIGLFLIFKAFSKKNIYLHIIGLLFIIIASFIRQTGIIIIISLIISYTIHNKYNKNFFISLTFAIITFLLFLLYRHWLIVNNNLPELYNIKESKLLFTLRHISILSILETILRIGEILVYIGLFIFPISFTYSFNDVLERISLKAKIITAIIILIIIYILILNKHLMPFRGNIIEKYGLGPLRLYDIITLKMNNIYIFPKSIWLFITIISIISATILIINIIHIFLNSHYLQNKQTFSFLFTIFTIYILIFGLAKYFDRYLLLLIPIGLYFCFIISQDLRKHYVYVLLLIPYAIFTVGGTHDYLSFHRTKWRALNYLVKELKVPYQEIDGGFEFNGLTGFKNFKTPKGVNPLKSWWWVYDDKYVISLGKIDGYYEIKKFPFKKWIPYKTNYIYVLRRIKD